jgi:hypothetical protein
MAASYPTAVKSFTVKSAGDTIQPTHINDLQDEVAAIEDGILNGTAPLTSSNARVANLSVAGGSTLANLQAGNSTIAGTLTVTTIISTSVNPAGLASYVLAFAGSTQTNPSTALVTAALNQRVTDLSSEFDSTTFTFTPKSSGYYLINARITIGASPGGGGIRARVDINSTAAAQHDYNIAGGAGLAQTYPFSLVRNLSSGAAGSVTLRWTGAGSSGIQASSGVQYTALEITKLF